MTDKIVPSSSGGGDSNTSPPPKQCSPAKYWCFTLNNYSEEDISSIIEVSNQKNIDYIFGEEVGAEGTPHLQGFIRFKTKSRPMTIYTNKIHWEKSKSNFENNVNYCIKQEKYYTNMVLKKPLKTIKKEQLTSWQRNIIELIEDEPDERSIYWYWGEQGCGKTQFIKYLIHYYKAIVLNGKPSDMKNGIISYMDKNNGATPELILSNIGYDKDMDNINYSGYEDIKDMVFYSGKYEGGMVCGNNPHLYIFSNKPPNTDNKKFRVRQIKNGDAY